MQVVLLATDEEEQLSPLSGTVPGPLLPVVNRPVIGVALEILARAGLKRITVCLYRHSGSIAAYIGDGGHWGVKVTYAVQRQALGDAGAVGWALPNPHEPCLVLPASAVLDLDIEAALAYHRTHGGSATLILHEPTGRRVCHPLRVGIEGRVMLDPRAAEEGEHLAYTGAAILEPAAILQIPHNTAFDLCRQLVPALEQSGERVYGYVMSGYWNALDSFRAYHEAQQVFLYSAYSEGAPAGDRALPTIRYPSIEGRHIAPGIWVGANDLIHPSAQLAAPICIGAGCRIGADVELEPGTVIGPHVIIDDGATVGQSTILGQTYVGCLASIHGRVVSQSMMVDIYSGQSVEVTEPFLLSAIPLMESYPWIRRSIGVAVAVVLLVALSPLLLVIAALVAISSGGRVIEEQPCVGVRAAALTRRRKGTRETFGLLVFRTRRPSGTLTPLGRLLSACDLDHLPALWNIVRGDLDLVGVKPLSASQAARLNEDWHEKRDECPAGFTGTWFVDAPADGDLDAVLVADVYYAATHTWRTDLRLILRTPLAWLRRVRTQLVQRRYDVAPAAGEMIEASAVKTEW